MRRSPRAIGGALLVGSAVLMALLASVVSPFAPDQQDLAARLTGPLSSAGDHAVHLLGTDQLGRDLLSRILFGAQISLAASGASVVLAGSVGVTLGLIAGYRGGLVDTIVSRLVEFQLSLPALVLAILLMTVLRPSVVSVIVVLSVTGWPMQARMVRGQVLTIRHREFVLAARSVGCSEYRVMVRHVLPNIVAVVTIIATMQAAQFILQESALSFLGLGIAPPTPSWGSIINDGQAYISTAWWIEVFPGLALVLTVSGLALLGDWLRDHLDPRMRT